MRYISFLTYLQKVNLVQKKLCQFYLDENLKFAIFLAQIFKGRKFISISKRSVQIFDDTSVIYDFPVKNFRNSETLTLMTGNTKRTLPQKTYPLNIKALHLH